MKTSSTTRHEMMNAIKKPVKRTGVSSSIAAPAARMKPGGVWEHDWLPVSCAQSAMARARSERTVQLLRR